MKEEKFIKLAEKLIRFPSTANNLKAKEGVINFCADYIGKNKVFLKKFIEKGAASLVATLKNEKSPEVFMVGHLDVVASDKKDFIPEIKNGKVYGRGAADMKTQAAIMVEIFNYFAGKPNKPSLGLILTTDEEIGGRNGSYFLLNKKGYGCRLAIIPDGGKDLSHIVAKEKGVLHLKLTYSGKSAHAARPYLGENALDGLIDAYLKIKKTVPFLKKNEWKNSLNLAKIEGGEIINKVPDKASLYLDFRFVSEREKNDFLKKAGKTVKREKAKIEILADGSVFIQNPGNHFLKKWIKMAEESFGKKIIFDEEDAASDARFFKEKGSEVLMTRPEYANNHALNEWIDLKQSWIFYQMLKKYLEDIL